MSNKPVLVLKQASAIQTLQQVGGQKRPSFMNLARTALTGRDAQGNKVGVMRRLGNALGVGAKTAAAGATVYDTARSMHGGNLTAPFSALPTYQGYDPTGGLSEAMNENFGEGDSIQQRRNAPIQAQRQFQAQYGPQQITAPVPVQSAVSTNVPLPTQDGTANTAYTGTAPTTAPTTAPATAPATTSSSTMTPQAQTGNQLAQTIGQSTETPGPMMPTQTPAGVPQSVVGQTAREYAGATDQSTQTPGGPAVPQQTPGVQQQLQFRPSGPQGALPPNMSSAAQQRGPPPSPMDQAMATFNQTPSAHSTANPLSQSDINYANEVLAQYHNKLPQQQQASMNNYGSSAVSPQQAQGNFDVQWGQQDPNQSLGQSVNWNQWNDNLPPWATQKMLKAYISYLYANMGSYLYKMTPHEAGAFAVDVFFKMRE